MFCLCFFCTFLPILFTSNSVVFVGRGRKNISCLRTQGTLATLLVQVVNKTAASAAQLVKCILFALCIFTYNCGCASTNKNFITLFCKNNFVRTGGSFLLKIQEQMKNNFSLDRRNKVSNFQLKHR